MTRILRMKRLTQKNADRQQIQRVCLDLHGHEKSYFELYDAGQKKVRKIPGFVHCIFATRYIQRVFNECGIGYTVDTARVNEYHSPGCDMHVDNPSVGQVWGLMTLFSPCVMTFDEENTGRIGHALLPPRSFLRLSGELRWGWRHGISYDTPHTFKGRKIHDSDGYRLSIVGWRLNKGLVDMKEVSKDALQTLNIKQKEVIETQDADANLKRKAGKPEKEIIKEPMLGGDLEVQTDVTADVVSKQQDFEKLKRDFMSIGPKLEELKKLGTDATDEDAQRIFGVEDISSEGSQKQFEEMIEQAQRVSNMLREMKYKEPPQ
eukprot:PhM_4_TR5145/c6_g1_i1/m.75520